MEILLPDNPQVLADFALMLATANGGNLNGNPMKLLQAALNLDPNHQKSLAWCAIAAFDERDYTAAIGYWERLRKTFPPGSEGAHKVAARIAEARATARANTPASPPSARLH